MLLKYCNPKCLAIFLVILSVLLLCVTGELTALLALAPKLLEAANSIIQAGDHVSKISATVEVSQSDYGQPGSPRPVTQTQSPLRRSRSTTSGLADVVDSGSGRLCSDSSL